MIIHNSVTCAQKDWLPADDDICSADVCLDAEEEFVEYSMGSLPSARTEQIRGHLGKCERCNDLMNQFLDLLRQMRNDDTSSGDQAHWSTSVLFTEEIALIHAQVAESARQANAACTKRNLQTKPMNILASGRAVPSEQPHQAPLAPGPRSFAQDQLDLEKPGKRAVADWAMNKFCPSFGAGIVLDAGSACFNVWLAMREAIAGGRCDHINVKSSNFRVLHDSTGPVNANVLRNTSVDVLGDTFDPQHEAFQVTEPDTTMKVFDSFRPSEVYIGVSGIEFEGSRILIGFHGPREERHKRGLFRYPCRRRIVLTTGKKIGDAGGTVIDILAEEGHKAPIYLVTTQPGPDDSNRVAIETQLKRAQDGLFSDEMQDAITRRGIEVHWVVVDLEGNQIVDLVAPLKVR